jgi:hypothetical protein
MIEYQNIFTRVQVHSPVYPGVPLPRGAWTRQRPAGFNHLLGRFGDAQVGPIYLGTTGLLSLICGFIAFEIIGLNMSTGTPCSSSGSYPGWRSSRRRRRMVCTSRVCKMAAGG